MPAPNLPWIKFWPELVEHEKFARLTDAEAWTWVVVWAKASKQSKRWRFASIDHAVKVTGRPAKHIRRLIEVRLIDADEDGVSIHNARKWQDKYPSDYSVKTADNLPPRLPEHSRNGSVKTAATLPLERDRDREGDLEVEKEREREGDTAPKNGAAPRGNPRVQAVIDAFRAFTGESEPPMSQRDYAAIAKSTAPPELIVEAYLSVEASEWGDDFQRKTLSVHTAVDWVNAYVKWRDDHGLAPMKRRAAA